MYNKFDLFHLEFLITSYSLLLLYFGSEYNYRYLVYEKSYLKTQLSICIGLFSILIYIDIIGCVFQNNSLEDFFNFTPKRFTYLSIVLLSSIAVLIHNSYSVTQKVNSFEFVCLILWSLLGLIFLIKANDLLVVYLGMELSSFCFYILTTYKRNSSYATEAGLKYFLLGAVASGNLLLGIALFYASGATTNYQLLEALTLGLETFSGETLLQQLGLTFLLLSLLFKLASFPFHAWSIDVYDGGPLSSIIFLNSVPKIAFTSLLIKVVFSLGSSNLFTWTTILLLTGSLSIIWSSLAGLKQKRLKRLLAISSVGNIGFVLVGLASGTLQGVIGSLLYLFSYIVATINCWLLLGAYRGTQNHNLTQNLISFRSLLIKVPVTGSVVGIIFLSFAGIPPFLGFTSKFMVLSILFNASVFTIATIIAIFSFFSVFYYLRVSKIIFFEATQDSIRNIQFDPWSSWVISCLFFAFTCLSLYPQPLLLVNTVMGLNTII